MYFDCIVHIVVDIGVVGGYDDYIEIDVCIYRHNDVEFHVNLIVNVVVDLGILVCICVGVGVDVVDVEIHVSCWCQSWYSR